MTRPIVFLTDYGRSDAFVGICHGVIARIAPAARVIDLSHAVPRQDVLRGAVEVARAVPYLPEDAIYVAVVDPGVGSDRRAVATAAGAALLVGPDNGVLSLAWAALGGVETAVEIASPKVILEPVSRTFHGRDVFAPAAGAPGHRDPARGAGAARRSRVAGAPGRAGADGGAGRVGARVTAVDGFGNVQLNAGERDLDAAGVAGGRVLVVNGRRVPRAGTFAELPEREPGIIVDSDGFLAIVVNRGNAAAMLGLAAGDAVVVESG